MIIILLPPPPPFRTALDSILVKLWIFLKRMFTRIVSAGRDKKLLHFSQAQSEVIWQRIDHYEATRLRVESVIWFLVSLLLAIFVKKISYIISLTGGLAAAFIFLFPALILIQLMLRPKSEMRYTDRCRVLSICTGCVSFVIGTFIFGVSVIFTIMQDAGLLVE